MLKDIILAIILGTLLGFGLTGSYYAINKNKSTQPASGQPISNQTQPENNQKNDNPSPTPQNLDTLNHQITIVSPQNQSIVSSSSLTIKGSTSSNSNIIITTPLKSYYSQSDNVGNFSIDIEIDSGANLIGIDSIDSQGNQVKTTLLVTYSTAKI